MSEADRAGGGGAAMVRTIPRNLMDDLSIRSPLPLPRINRPRWAAYLPHTLVVVFAAFMLHRVGNYPLDRVSLLLAVLDTAVLVLALFHPVLAWWAGLVLMVIGVQAAKFPEGSVSSTAPGMDASVTLPWTVPGVALQAGVLFLLALRVRPRALATMLTINVLTALACISFNFRGLNYNAGLALAGFVTAALLGTTLRSRETFRSRLVVQEEITAEERARRALLEERTRIARELHDVVAHHMSVVSIQAQVAPHLADNPSRELQENLESIRQNTVEALSELRRVLGVLRSEKDDLDGAPYGSQPTLERLEDLLCNVRTAGIEADLEITGTPVPLPSSVELSAFRIVQEALSNAMRHAPGSSVRVEVGHHPAMLRVRIANTAPQRPARPSPGSGHGLIGMRERVAMLDGDLSTRGTADGGYEVLAHLPVSLPTPEEAGRV
ncbi:sensor histidine kinase [Streptomyces violaceoruber]